MANTITLSSEMLEQIVNGGFETGDWTGWTHTSSASISSSDPHSGTYCVHLEASGEYISQTLSTPILGSLVQSFGFYAKSAYNNFDVILNFSDLTSKTASGLTGGGSEIYYYYNIMNMSADEGGPLFPSEKTLVSIIIRQYSDNILSVDDVSLISGTILTLHTENDLRAIDFENERECVPAVSDWLNSTPNIQINVWSKKKEIVTYTIRQTDAELYALLECLEGIGVVYLNDDVYPYVNELVVVSKVEAVYDAYIDCVHSWSITLELKRINI